MSSKYKLPKSGGIVSDFLSQDIIRRHEKISTSIFSDESVAVQYIADQIEKAIKEFTEKSLQTSYDDTSELFKLGLSTGRTPVGLYRELVKRYQQGDISFEKVEVFTIDEFYPRESVIEQSRNRFIYETLINHINIDANNVHIIDGAISLKDVPAYCKRYDALCRNMDLIVVGFGEDGQLGFNEPGSFEKSQTRLVQLSYNTRKEQAALLSSCENSPTMAITIGINTIMSANRIILMAWSEDKASIVQKVVEGEVTSNIPASFLQQHPNIEVIIDEDAAGELTREQSPWLVGPCQWTPALVRKAVIWLCGKVDKPVLKLTYRDYIENSLSELLDKEGSYDQINIRIFNDLQHTITGWPGGKPNADDTTRPVPSTPHQKRVLIFSPHPDDDVISMGGTFIRLVEQNHDVHVAYQVSGNVAVHDDVVVQSVETAKELGYIESTDEVKALIANKRKGAPEPRELLEIKGGIRRSEARAACRSFGLNDKTQVHFLNLPFYETGGIKKGVLSQDDIDIIINLLREVKPHQIYAAGDLTDPHGTHRVCMEAILEALEQIKDDEWLTECHLWLYRGAWQEWGIDLVDMAVPLSPDELIKKREAIYRHNSQKDIVPFPGDDSREFWQRAEDRTQNTARMYDLLGMAEYQAIEVFVKMF